MSCKVISQNVIQNNTVVRLNEKQARAVATDLVRYDACKATSKLQDERIDNLLKQTFVYDNQLKVKDSIISTQKDFIKYQDEIINKPFKPELHGYLGINTVSFTLANPFIYGTLLLEFEKFSIGWQYFVQPNNPSGHGFIVEYNLF
jgi:hypothetical protein